MAQVIPKHLPDITCQHCWRTQKDRGQGNCLSCNAPLVRKGDTIAEGQFLEDQILKNNEWPERG